MFESKEQAKSFVEKLTGSLSRNKKGRVGVGNAVAQALGMNTFKELLESVDQSNSSKDAGTTFYQITQHPSIFELVRSEASKTSSIEWTPDTIKSAITSVFGNKFNLDDENLIDGLLRLMNGYRFRFIQTQNPVKNLGERLDSALEFIEQNKNSQNKLFFLAARTGAGKTVLAQKIVESLPGVYYHDFSENPEVCFMDIKQKMGSAEVLLLDEWYRSKTAEDIFKNLSKDNVMTIVLTQASTDLKHFTNQPFERMAI